MSVFHVGEVDLGCYDWSQKQMYKLKKKLDLSGHLKTPMMRMKCYGDSDLEGRKGWVTAFLILYHAHRKFGASYRIGKVDPFLQLTPMVSFRSPSLPDFLLLSTLGLANDPSLHSCLRERSKEREQESAWRKAEGMG